MLDELRDLFLEALRFGGDNALPLVNRWNDAVKRVQKRCDECSACKIRIAEEKADVRPVACKVKIYNDPWTGKLYTTCSSCDWKVGPKDAYCKHCGAEFKEEKTDG